MIQLMGNWTVSTVAVAIFFCFLFIFVGGTLAGTQEQNHNITLLVLLRYRVCLLINKPFRMRHFSEWMLNVHVCIVHECIDAHSNFPHDSSARLPIVRFKPMVNFIRNIPQTTRTYRMCGDGESGMRTLALVTSVVRIKVPAYDIASCIHS